MLSGYGFSFCDISETRQTVEATDIDILLKTYPEEPFSFTNLLCIKKCA